MMKESLPRVYSSDEELFTPIDHETPDLLEDHRLEPYRGNKAIGGQKTLPPKDPPIQLATISPTSREDDPELDAYLDFLVAEEREQG